MTKSDLHDGFFDYEEKKEKNKKALSHFVDSLG